MTEHFRQETQAKDWDLLIDQQDHFEAEVENAEDQGDPEPEWFNDAELLGVEPEEFGDVLDRPVTFLTGELWGAKDRRNTQDGKWKAATMPLSAWMIGGPKKGGDPAWGFTRHPVGKHKEGACVVLGSSIDGARKAKAMTEMHAIGLDVDSGAKLDDVLAILEEKGIFAIVYTSFNHGKSGLAL